LLTTNQFCGERSSSSFETTGLSLAFITLFDLIIEFCSHRNGQSVSNNGWYYSFQLLVEVYSFFMLLFMYFSLKNFSSQGFHENFKSLFRSFYTQIHFWGTSLIATGIAVMLSEKDINIIPLYKYSNQNLVQALLYLVIYFVILAIIMRKFFFLTREEKKLMLFLVLLFPVVSLSDDCYTIPVCQSENYTLQNYPAIYPLAYATPKALFNLCRHWNDEKFSHDIQIALYSIIQLGAVLYLFPSLININNENDYKLK
jgi:hypothetical protein